MVAYGVGHYSEDEVRRMTRMIVEKWMSGWGDVERERLVTGDVSAIPKGNFEVAGGKRGSPSDPCSLLEVWSDVEITIGTRRPALRVTLLHKYRDGFREEAQREFDFGGPDFRAFFSVERWEDIERGMRGSGKSVRWLFGRLVNEFEVELAKERGLRKVAESYLARGNEPSA